MDRDATFNEDDIQKLLARAAELQAASDDASSAPGLTIQEVEQAAESAGLDPRHVRQAARELSRPKTTHASTDVNDSHLFVERRIDRPVSDDAWTAVLSELRHRTGVPQGWSVSSPFEWSTTDTIGNTREWTHHRLGNTRELRVSLRPSGEQTQLRLAKRTSTDGTPLLNAIGIGLACAIVAASIVGGTMTSWLWALVGGVIAFSAAAPAAYAGIRAWRQSQLRSLETLADQLERVLVESSSTASSSPMDPSSQHRLEQPQGDASSSNSDLPPRRRERGTP